MKKNILSLVLLGLLILPVVVSADLLGEGPSEDVDIETTLGNIRNLVFGIFLFFAAIMLIWAGFTFVTAGGDSTKVSAAREKVLYALIGIVVAVASAGIIQFVKNTLVE